jgi:hypothetical protein
VPGGLDDVAGTYERLHNRIVATVRNDRVELAIEPSGVLEALGAKHSVMPVEPLGPADVAGRIAMVGSAPVSARRELAVFTPATDEQPAGVHLFGRLHRRVG